MRIDHNIRAPEGTGEPTTIADRVAVGKATGSSAGGAIVPADLANVPIPNALSGKQATDIGRLLGNGATETRYIYRAPTGEAIFAVCRFDQKDGDKTFRPLRCKGFAADGTAIFDLTAIYGLRPLYNLDKIIARPEAEILMVEGEKAADAAEARFPDMVVSTWSGGANSVGRVDARDAAGRRVVVVPDQDAAGKQAGEHIAAKLLAVGCTVRVVDLPAIYPDKYDLADPDPVEALGDLSPEALIANAPAIEGDAATELMRKHGPRADRVAAARPKPAGPNAEICRSFSAARFLAAAGKRDYHGYSDWFDLMCASKNSLGEDGYAEFRTLSAEFGGTDDDETFRRKWDSVQDRGPDEPKLTMATFFKEAIEAGWQDPTADDAEGGGGGRGGGRVDPAALVLAQAADAGDVLWIDQFGKPHVSILVEGVDGAKRTVHMRVGGKRHRAVVSRRYNLATPGKVLAGEPERRAMALFEHEARETGPTFDSAIRVAAHDGCIYVDLGQADGRAVRVDRDGWEVVENPPVRFVRGRRGALPLPEAGGSLDLFRRHLNLDERGVFRFVGFLVGALSPLPSFPILLILGPQGSAKSTLGDLAVALVDPAHSTKAARLSMPRSEQHLLVHASGVRVVFVDNLTDVSGAESDSFCRLSTGGGSTARALYSDDEENQINAVRPVVLTAIGVPTGRGDFLDRCVLINAQPIEHRRTEETVLRAFEADRPQMFGFLLDALSASIRNKAEVEGRAESGELRLARMADFTQCVEAAAPVLGLAPGAFAAGLIDEQAALQAESALGDPLGEAIVRYFSGLPEGVVLDGFATEILDDLRTPRFDKTPLPASNKLKGALRRIEPGLADLGLRIEIREPSGHARKTRYRIERTAAFDPIGQQLPF